MDRTSVFRYTENMKKFIFVSLLMAPLAFAHATDTYFLNDNVYSQQVRSETYKEISAQNLPAIRELVFSQFNTEQDHQYFDKTVESFKPYKVRISVSEKNQTVSIFGDSFDVTLSEVHRDNKSLKINGQPFQFTQGQSLEAATTQILSILNKRQTQNHPGLMPLLLGPEAHAMVPLIAAGATVVSLTAVLPSALNEVRILALTDTLENMTLHCKKRKPGASYEESQAYQDLRKASSGKPVFSLEEQRQITDCKQWAESGKLKNYSNKPKKIQKLCELGREAQKCMDEFKAESDARAKKQTDTKKLKAIQ